MTNINWHRIKGVIFDMDGTLLDSMAMWDNLPPSYFQKHNVEYRPEYLRDIAAYTLEQAAEIMAAKHFPNLTGAEMFQDWTEYLMDNYLNKVQLKPGTYEFLTKLEAHNKKMCIATMTDQNFVQPVMERFGLNKFMAFTKSIADVGKSKSHPDIFLECADLMGAKPAECVVIEDSVTAAETARSAGFQVIGIFDEGSACDAPKLMTICHEFIKDFNQIEL